MTRNNYKTAGVILTYLFLLGLAAGAASAALIQPTGITVTGPASGSPYTDDVFLESLMFPGGIVYTVAGDAFRSVQSATVLEHRDSVNAEFGDNDDGTDGNPNPFVTAGIINEGDVLEDSVRETTTPWIQDAAILASFNGLSLNQGIDGENEDYLVQMVFENGIVDNDPNTDIAPELIFFERGVNSDFRVQLILGGTWVNPVLSDPVDILRSQLWATGISINTIEINNAQELGAVGIDLNDFKVNGVDLAPGSAAYGVRIRSLNDSGADLYGSFLAASDPGTQYVPVPPSLEQTPEPGTVALFGAGLLAMVALRRRKTTDSEQS